MATKLTFVQQRNKAIYEAVQLIMTPDRLTDEFINELVRKYTLTPLSLDKNKAKQEVTEFTLRLGREPRNITVSSANAQCLKLTLAIPYEGSNELAEYAMKFADKDFTELSGKKIIAKAYNRLIQRNDDEAQVQLQQSIKTIEKYFEDANGEATNFNGQVKEYVKQVVFNRYNSLTQ